MSSYLDEAQLEIATIDYFSKLGYDYIHGPTIAPERAGYAQVVLLGRLCNTLPSKG